MKTSLSTFLVVATSSLIYSLVGALPPVTRASNSIPDNTGSPNTILLQSYPHPADNEDVKRLIAAFADTMELAGKVVDAAAWDTPTFNLYFPPEARDSVASFFQKLHAGNPRGAEVMRQVVFDNNDVPDGLDPGHRPLCLANNFAAYTQNTKPQPKMHVCPYMWKIPRLRDVAESVCKGSQMSKGMIFQGSILLHEFAHVDVLRTPNGSGKHVGDFTYGPLNVRNLRKNHPEDALYNADSYMWFALEVYWTSRCGKTFVAPTGS